MVEGHDPDPDGAPFADPAPAPVARFGEIGDEPAQGIDEFGGRAQVASFADLGEEPAAPVTELGELESAPAGSAPPVAGFADVGASRPDLPRVVRLSELSAPAGRARERRSGQEEGERSRPPERTADPRPRTRTRRKAREAAPGPGFGPGPEDVPGDPDEHQLRRWGAAGDGAGRDGAGRDGVVGEDADAPGTHGPGAGGPGAGGPGAGGPGAGGPGAGGPGKGARGRTARRGWGQPAELPPGTDPVAAAKEICLRLLSDRARTRQELAQALQRKGVPDQAADSVLERFDEVGLIDDAAFAGQWVRSRHTYKGLARRAIAVELRRKGVDDEVAGAALAEVDPESEEQRAEELVRRKLRTLTVDTPDQKASATRRLVGMLARKGYGAGTAYRVVKEALAQHGVELDEFGEAEPGD